jgi:hypothetical protein
MRLTKESTETFEGLALGSRIASLPWSEKQLQPWIMSLAYGCTYVYSPLPPDKEVLTEAQHSNRAGHWPRNAHSLQPRFRGRAARGRRHECNVSRTFDFRLACGVDV